MLFPAILSLEWTSLDVIVPMLPSLANLYANQVPERVERPSENLYAAGLQREWPIVVFAQLETGEHPRLCDDLCVSTRDMGWTESVMPGMRRATTE